MLCYRDMTFCQSDCTNKECSRFISEAVVEGSEKTGLPLAVSDFSETCEDYQAEKKDD